MGARRSRRGVGDATLEVGGGRVATARALMPDEEGAKKNGAGERHRLVFPAARDARASESSRLGYEAPAQNFTAVVRRQVSSG